jgi:hypothetical protein
MKHTHAWLMEKHLVFSGKTELLLGPLEFIAHLRQFLLDDSIFPVLLLHEEFLSCLVLIKTRQFYPLLDAFNLGVDKLAFLWEGHRLKHNPRLK